MLPTGKGERIYETVASYRKIRTNYHIPKYVYQSTTLHWLLKKCSKFPQQASNPWCWRPSSLRVASENVMRLRIQSVTAFGIQPKDYQYIFFFTFKCSDTIRNKEGDKVGKFTLKRIVTYFMIIIYASHFLFIGILIFPSSTLRLFLWAILTHYRISSWGNSVKFFKILRVVCS